MFSKTLDSVIHSISSFTIKKKIDKLEYKRLIILDLCTAVCLKPFKLIIIFNF